VDPVHCHKWAHGHCAGFSDFLFVSLLVCLFVGIATLLIAVVILSLNTDVIFVT
jgi:hypothetical protein